MNFNNVSLDLTDIGGKIVSISGDNGAGKTTLLECLGFTSLYREFPSRGRGIDKFCSSNAFLEHEFEFGGNLYISKMLINAKSGKIESYLYENGIPLNDNGKKDSFSEAVVKRFGTKELALSSVFSAQDKVGSFMVIPRTERKNLFISMLNLGILQQISTFARDMEGQEEAKEKDINIKIDSLRVAADSEIPSEDTLRNEIDLTNKALSIVEHDLKQDLIALEAEKEKQKAQQSIIDQKKAYSLEWDILTRRYDRVLQNINNTEDNIKNLNWNKDVSELRVIAKGLPLLEVKKDAMELELRRQTNEQNEFQKKNNEIQNKINSEKKDLDNYNKERSRAVDAGKALSRVPCGGEGIYSGCPLIKNSVLDKETLGTIDDCIGRCEERIKQYEEEKSNLKRPAGNDKLGAEIAIVGQEIQRARKAEKEISEVQANQDKLKVYTESLVEMKETAEHTSRDMESLKTKIDLLGLVGIVEGGESLSWTLTKRIATYDIQIKDLKDKIHQYSMNLGRAEVIRKNVESAQKSIKNLNKELDGIRDNKRHWGHLSYAFGPRAIQSVEIDSAGPWVSDIINELLRNCFGPRFTVKMITQAERSDKSGMKDAFDIEVIDSDKNRTGFIGDLSGGEKVIVSEAVSLGICLYNSHRGGIKWDTLYRDECSGALDDANSMRYINMLRKAVDLGGFKKCLFIAHQPELIDASDNKIRISDGRITVS